MTLAPARFHPDHLPRNTRTRSTLEVGDGLGFPVLLARGARPGPTLVVTAGVHGDEYEGVRAILEAFDAVDPGQMSGDLLAVPVVNGAAFWSGTRTSPLDGANLARVFPGNPDGTPSEKIAWVLAHSVIAHADFYLDLHSAGIRYRMPAMVGYPSADSRAIAAAERFGAPVLWGHAPPINPGRTVSFAADRGIPWLYTEARGAGRIDAGELRMMKRGIENLLGHLGILGQEPEIAAVTTRLRGSGNTDAGLTANHAGFLLKYVEILQQVEAGQLLGRLVNLTGEPIEEFRAPAGGIVAMTREYPVVQPGEVMFVFAETQPCE